MAEATASGDHPPNAGTARRQVRHVVDGQGGDRVGEGIVRKRERGSIGADEGQVRMLGPGLCEHGLREVSADRRGMESRSRA